MLYLYQGNKFMTRKKQPFEMKKKLYLFLTEKFEKLQI